jgi:hypothetical protein
MKGPDPVEPAILPRAGVEEHLGGRLVPSTVQTPWWVDASTFRNPPRGLATLKLNPVGGAVGASIRGAEGRIAEALAARDASRPIIGHPPIAMGLEAWMANNLSHAPM